MTMPRPRLSPAPPPGGPLRNPPQMSEATFRRLTVLVRDKCGIALAPSKRQMLQTRLSRRLKAAGVDDFDAYQALLTGPNPPEGEMQAFVDCVVTNETSFFRERPHFDFLTPQRLGELAEGGRAGQLSMWSAACSTGEEVWTMAMVAEAASTALPEAGRWSWSAVATDISIKALTQARTAIYETRDVAKVPPEMAARYVMRARDGASAAVRMAPALRRHVRFGQINLMHPRYLPGRLMDIIFCRNVLIYFDNDVQQQIVRKLCTHLRPGGLLFLGHSDMSRERQAPLRLLRNNIHERLED